MIMVNLYSLSPAILYLLDLYAQILFNFVFNCQIFLVLNIWTKSSFYLSLHLRAYAVEHVQLPLSEPGPADEVFQVFHDLFLKIPVTPGDKFKEFES